MDSGEIFSRIATRQINGVMFHEELSNFFSFLGLSGYKRQQENRCADEYLSYRRTLSCYMAVCNRLVMTGNVERQQTIPDSWYNHAQNDMDPETERKAVKEAFTRWTDWERETKKIFEELLPSLQSELLLRSHLEELIKDVTEELSNAELQKMLLERIGYDLGTITVIQNSVICEERLAAQKLASAYTERS